MDIEPTRFTDAERQDYYEDLLTLSSEESGLSDPPDVDLIAWSQGLAEYGENQARCLDAAGFSTVSDGAGAWQFDPGVPESQDEALQLASYVCNAQYPVEPQYAQNWTEEQVGLVYDYWDQYYIPCMEAHGHPISRGQQPSREAYVTAFNSPDRISWWPNEASMNLPFEEQQTLAGVCPQYPPESAMYGE